MKRDASSGGSKASLVDRGFQLAYVCAYRTMRMYWKVRHPTTHGALVTLWNQGEVLLIRNSYVPHYGLPGGYVHRGEAARDAAVRELREEVSVVVNAAKLELVFDQTHEWEGKRDHVEIFSLSLDERPRIVPDQREVIEASWWTPERALSLVLFPPLRTVLERAQAAGSPT